MLSMSSSFQVNKCILTTDWTMNIPIHLLNLYDSCSSIITTELASTCYDFIMSIVAVFIFNNFWIYLFYTFRRHQISIMHLSYQLRPFLCNLQLKCSMVSSTSIFLPGPHNLLPRKLGPGVYWTNLSNNSYIVLLMRYQRPRWSIADFL